MFTRLSKLTGKEIFQDNNANHFWLLAIASLCNVLNKRDETPLSTAVLHSKDLG
jgi:hypothetical protein